MASDERAVSRKLSHRRIRAVAFVVGLVLLAIAAVLAARGLRELEAVQAFLLAYPGSYPLPDGAPVGIPAWLGWQHFFNVFLLVLIVRSGLQARAEKPPSDLWTSRRNRRRRMTLTIWLHHALDVLWVANGILFVVLLVATGQWMRIVPTSWEVFPNALAAGLQYVSLDWPTEHPWTHYNALQQLSYFTTVFIAAPLAIVSGIRMSAFWPRDAVRLNALYPFAWAKRLHLPVMIYFVAFTVVHVALVLATGALRNLNAMYASRDDASWVGFWVFVASLVVIAAGWLLMRHSLVVWIARRFGDVLER